MLTTRIKQLLILIILFTLSSSGQVITPPFPANVIAPAASNSALVSTSTTAASWKSIPDTTTNCLGYTGGVFGIVGCGSSGGSVVNVTPITVNANSTAEQFLREITLPTAYLNSLRQPFMFIASGVYTAGTGLTSTHRYRLKLCTVSGCGSGTVVTLVDITTTAQTATASNNGFGLSILGVTAATGVNGNLEVHGPLTIDLGASNVVADSIFWDVNTAVSANIDLTASLFVDWTITFSTNGATPNSITQRVSAVSPFTASSSVASVTGTANQITCSPTTGSVVCSSQFSSPQLITVVGPSVGRTWTVPDSAFSLARTDFGQTFTGTQVMTSPKIITDIRDTNGNAMITISPTTAAVDNLSVTNAATANPATVKLSTTGSDSNVNLVLNPQGTGKVKLSDGTDTTKLLSVDMSGAATGTTLTVAGPVTVNRTLTLPDATDTLVAKNTTDTLTNKTITGNTAVNLISGSGTLTLNTTGTATVPNGTDTLVARSTTDTLTNKRVTKRVVTASDATSITPNSDNADDTYQLNTQATGTLTINADAGTPTNGQVWILKIKSTNVQTFSWNAVYVGGATALPTVTTGGSKIDYFAFIYDTVNSKWQFQSLNLGF